MKNSFGVIDIGSNSVRMVIYDLMQSPPVQIFNEKVFCALGRDLAATGKLNPEGAEAALGGLRDYARIAQEHALDRLDVVGTAALRDASDAPEFIARVAAETGLSIRLISGDEEARYAALGVLSLDPAANGIVADFGGGSLEFAWIANGKVGETISQPYGAFRVLSMKDEAEDILAKGLQQMSTGYGKAPALYSIGGSWRALAQAYMLEAGHETELQGYEIAGADIIPFCEKIAVLTADDVRTLYKIDDKRAVLAPVSAFVLKQVMTILGPRKMVVSMAGIRDGIVYDFNNR
jgi:exopolyphosphatase/guanosine-5'-triphosphate,3'-diphosphate pyrophosphatase